MDEDGAGEAHWLVGVDVGGTFTDIVAVHRTSGEVRDGKVLSTVRQEDGVLAAIAAVGLDAAEVEELVHGHTVGINAILSRTGSVCGLLATSGHRDLLDIGRMNREFGENFYDPTWLRPHQQRPIVSRDHRVGVLERTAATGQELTALDEEAVRAAVRAMVDDGVEAIGVCFLNAYTNPAHEQRAAEIVREEFSDLYVQTSALYPVTKEHERTTTVALDAYAGPTVTGYLDRLRERLDASGFGGSLWIMMMNGGVVSLADARRAPVFQLVSGPVGGVAGAIGLARRAGLKDLVTMDVGGTSTDVATVKGIDVPLTDLWTVEHGLTLTMPLVDVGSVGSGAGSIIGVDPLGALRVGPASAGSVPGPASYGRGGEAPTLTDACVALGLLQPDLFAGGSLALQPDLARHALAGAGVGLGKSDVELAEAAYQVACEDVAAKIRSISVYRGVDVREFTLLPFGAAGPMLANRVAQVLRLGRTVIPPNPGQFSALGLLASDLRVTRAGSPMTPLVAGAAGGIEEAYRALEEAIGADLAGQGVDLGALSFERAWFAMYAGQTWDNRLPLAPGALSDERVPALQAEFHTFYREAYGFSAEELPVILTSIEVTAVVPRPGTAVGRSAAVERDSFVRTARVLLPGHGEADVEIHDREALAEGRSLRGPALVVEDFATTVVLPGHTLRREGDLLVIDPESTGPEAHS